MRPSVRRLAAALLVPVAGLAPAACARAAEPDAIDVFAAASLTEAFRAVAALPGAPPVRFAFAGSPALVAQVEQGAPADVIVTADEESMQRLARAGRLDGAPVVFVRNRLAIAVAPGNPRGIARLRDLARPGIDVALCAPEVPCGRAAGAALRRAGAEIAPVTSAESVKAVVTAVALGEADAGVVYETDVRAATGVDGVAIPEADNVTVAAAAAVVRGAAAGARAFVSFLLAPQAQERLRALGFGAP